jgi:RNA polymerase sigma factor (sigma-70 family)
MEASAARRPSHPGPRVPARLLRLASDDRLVEYVRGGSEPAFEAVFDRHHRGILAFCRHMLGSAEEAEDAVQHTFMAAYRSLVGSSKPIQLRAWLYTIARNRCLSVLRARREKPVDDLGELPTDNLSAEVQRRQDLRDMLLDISELPEEQRAALVLAEVGGVSHDDISQVLGVPREKVKALVFQARSSLISSREARETPCEDIRIQLAELRGGALRRNNLRRHLKSCAGCREFRAAVQDQRKMLALALPVVPTIALKQGVMASALGSGAAAGGAAAVGGATAGGSLLAGGGTALTAKVLAVAALAGGGAVGVKAISADEPVATRPAAAGQGGGQERGGPGEPAPSGRGGAVAPAAVGGAEQEPEDGAKSRARKRRSEQRSKGRRGEERRSERASERAAGPGPEQAQKPSNGVNERALERRDARGPDARSRGKARARAKLRAPKAEKLAKPAPAPRAAPAPRPERTAAPAPTPEPVATPVATPEPAPTTLPDDGGSVNGGAKAAK